jgi:hypothetical protein
MDDSEMTKKTFAEWLIEAATGSQSEFESAHLDEFDLPQGYRARGLELVRNCCALLEQGRTILGQRLGVREIRFLLVFLPLSSSECLSFWTDDLWDAVGAENEPPTLYLMARDQVLDEWDEEYRRPLDPLPEYPQFLALYRCWRTKIDMQNSWGFERGVYLVLDVHGHG